MRPDHLVISAWGPYKERAEIDFTKFQGEGLFLITGATGAGKTTIFDAITYALYGALSGQMREKGSVRSDFAAGETPTFVELTMTHGGKEYRIYRNPEYMRPKKKRGGHSELTREKENAILYLPEGAVVEGTREVNARMQEILVLDYQQFKQISMIAQGEFSRMLTASPREKIGIFREIFGTGVCDRFMQILRSKSGALYQKAAEQRHKLEEDVRLLLAGGDRGLRQQELEQLTELENWNYEAIRECLELWGQELGEQMQENGERYGSLDEQAHRLTETLTRQQEQNRKLRQWQDTCVKLQGLKARREAVSGKEGELKQALTAAAAEPKEILHKALCDQQRKNEENGKDLLREQEKLRQEQADLQRYSENRALIEEGLLLCSQWKEAEKEALDCRERQQEIDRQYQAALALYLELEKSRDQVRCAYEEADRAYRHGVIGLAASQLKSGKPCPVCGALEHPRPAPAAEGVLSQSELRGLKEKLQKQEQMLGEQQSRAMSLQALLGSLKQQEEVLQGRQQHCERAYGSARACLGQKEIRLEELTGEKLRELLQRFDRAAGLLSSKEQEILKNKSEKKALEAQVREARTAFEQALSEAGFDGAEGYHCAIRSLEERTRLEKEIAEYKEEMAGTLSLKEHLEQEMDSREPAEEGATRAALTQTREKKEAVREKQERLGSLADAVGRTMASVKEKQAALAKISEEYGYVKDLDNMASGNNRRRLVFEQYVLTGYFREILRAANLRFFRMTGGRYEMSCVEEAGDGRSKDSLEIEVMDYYTGKARSVKTLSGGESFKASLSLALGLSDVIQATSGGIRVEALFVDEGFGALDSESLDQACEALRSLVEQDRMIGIISHVQELRERLDRQIIIEKTNSGSAVKIVV